MKRTPLKVEARRELVAFIGFFYLVPIFMLYFGFLPFWTRHVVLVLTSLVLTAYAIGKPIALRELGFRGDNLKPAFVLNGIFTFLGLLAVYLGWKFGILKPTYLGGETLAFYMFYVFISAPVQEFVFRALMFYELNLLVNRGDWFKVIFSAFIFSIAHVVYKDPAVLLATFSIGLVWGWIYLKRPNFWGVALSHAILGAVTVFFGIV